MIYAQGYNEIGMANEDKGIEVIIFDQIGVATPKSYLTRLQDDLRTNGGRLMSEVISRCPERAARVYQKYGYDLLTEPSILAGLIADELDRDYRQDDEQHIRAGVNAQSLSEGRLKGEITDYFLKEIQRAKETNTKIGIFSTLPVQLQEAIFKTSDHGDVLPEIAWLFDTGIGQKTGQSAYRNIASRLKTSPERILYRADSLTEVEAAKAAGWQAEYTASL